MEEKYYIGNIPFYYTALQKPSNPEDLPNKLSFILTQDSNGIFKQMPSEGVQEYLDLAYQKGSQISGLMDDKGIGKLYTDDFVKYICDKKKSFVGKKVLEIGCGTGYLLYKLQELGAEVLGIEPGQYGLEGRKRFGIPILIDFFNPAKLTEKYDIIIFFGVLEHMQDANCFLEDVKSVLKEDGEIFLAVPDCEPYIQVGDVSMLIHEHWYYFTRNTLASLLKNNGLTGDIARSKFAGALYAILKKGNKREGNVIDLNLLSVYAKKIEIQKINLYRYIESILPNKTLGIYVPGRIINILSVCYEEVPKSIRFFDDNENIYGTYFPGINIAIENFDDFVKNPVDAILIASFTFGEKIKKRLLESENKCDVILLEELFM